MGVLVDRHDEDGGRQGLDRLHRNRKLVLLVVMEGHLCDWECRDLALSVHY